MIHGLEPLLIYDWLKINRCLLVHDSLYEGHMQSYFRTVMGKSLIGPRFTLHMTEIADFRNVKQENWSTIHSPIYDVRLQSFVAVPKV
jgi:hypothetical protein